MGPLHGPAPRATDGMAGVGPQGLGCAHARARVCVCVRARFHGVMQLTPHTVHAYLCACVCACACGHVLFCICA